MGKFVVWNLLILCQVKDTITFTFDSKEKLLETLQLIEQAGKNYPLLNYDSEGKISGVKCSNFEVSSKDLESARSYFVSCLKTPEYMEKSEMILVLDMISDFECETLVTEEILHIR
jgi:hypothetical protein